MSRTTSSTPTVGSFLFDYIYNQGVHHAFGIPGDFALPTFRWLDKSPIDLITMTHEPSVGFAADGYARVHGMGLACVTYCVGGLNMLNAIACAYAEKSPVIVVSGGPSPADRHSDPLLHHKVRSFDTQRRIYDEVTCASAVLLEPERAADEIIRVVQEVQRQCRPGYIEIPYDVVDMPVRMPTVKNTPPEESDREVLAAAIAEATDFINRSKQPVIVADVELHRHGLTDLAVEIARKFNIPIAATLLSKSVIRETNPLYIGVYSGAMSEPAVQKYVEDSDCGILLGAFITDVFLGMNSTDLDRSQCILANTERTQIGYHSFEGVVFRDFLEGLANADIRRRDSFTNPNPHKLAPPLAKDDYADDLNAESLFSIVSHHVAEESTVVCDTGDALLGAIGLRTGKRSNFLSDAYYLSMGFAIPAAIGAMAANPDSRALVLVGDGAFQMTGIELSTVAKENMHPIVLIINNDGYGTQRHIIDGKFNNIHKWNYTGITDLLGYGKSRRVTTKGELQQVLDEAVADPDNMYLIEAVVPRDDCSRSLKQLGENLARQRDSDKRSA